jgi:hypothetical protein
MVNDIYIIRFAVNAKYANDEDMREAFRIIQEHSDNVLIEHRTQRSSSGRQSSSNDSLDLATNQVATVNNTEIDTAISEETATPEAIPETTVAQMVYPPRRTARVKRTEK